MIARQGQARPNLELKTQPSLAPICSKCLWFIAYIILRARPFQVIHLSGRLLALPANIRLACVFGIDKHCSLFCLAVSDAGKKFYNTDPRAATKAATRRTARTRRASSPTSCPRRGTPTPRRWLACCRSSSTLSTMKLGEQARLYRAMHRHLSPSPLYSLRCCKV